MPSLFHLQTSVFQCKTHINSYRNKCLAFMKLCIHHIIIYRFIPNCFCTPLLWIRLFFSSLLFICILIHISLHKNMISFYLLFISTDLKRLHDTVLVFFFSSWNFIRLHFISSFFFLLKIFNFYLNKKKKRV